MKDSNTSTSQEANCSGRLRIGEEARKQVIINATLDWWNEKRSLFFTYKDISERCEISTHVNTIRKYYKKIDVLMREIAQYDDDFKKSYELYYKRNI